MLLWVHVHPCPGLAWALTGQLFESLGGSWLLSRQHTVHSIHSVPYAGYSVCTHASQWCLGSVSIQHTVYSICYAVYDICTHAAVWKCVCTWCCVCACADAQIWAGPLSGGRVAVALVNKSPETRQIGLDLRTSLHLQWAHESYSVRDVWKVSGYTPRTPNTTSTEDTTVLLEITYSTSRVYVQ